MGKALALLGNTLAEHPRDADALLLRAQMEGQGGDMQAARKSIDLALEAGPIDPPQPKGKTKGKGK